MHFCWERVEKRACGLGFGGWDFAYTLADAGEELHSEDGKEEDKEAEEDNGRGDVRDGSKQCTDNEA